MTTFTCRFCGSALRAAAELAGRKAKCPKCGRQIVLQSSAKPAAAPSHAAAQRGAEPSATAKNVQYGKKTLRYECLKCATKLESPITTEGKQDTCPQCGTVFHVPYEPVEYDCSECGAILVSSSQLGGRKQRCPRCGRESVVPLTPRQMAAISAEQERRRKAEAQAAKDRARQEKAEKQKLRREEAQQRAAEAEKAEQQPAEAGQAEAGPEEVPHGALPQAAQTAIPESPPGAPAPEEVFADPEQWCIVPNELDPDSILSACREGKGQGLAVAIETTPDAVRLHPRPLPRSQLVGMLVKYPIWIALNMIGIIMCVLGPFIFIAAAFGSLSFFALAMLPWNIWSCIIEFFQRTILGFQYVAEWFKALFFLATNKPYTFVPFGFKLAEGAVAALSPGDVRQVIRLSLSSRQLTKRAKRKAPGCLSILLFPITIPLGILRKMLSMLRGKRRYDLVAFVVGEPIDLEESAGFFDNLKRKYRARGKKKRRMIALINLNPDSADAIVTAAASALKQQVIVVDDDVASKTIWR